MAKQPVLVARTPLLKESARRMLASLLLMQNLTTQTPAVRIDRVVMSVRMVPVSEHLQMVYFLQVSDQKGSHLRPASRLVQIHQKPPSVRSCQTQGHRLQAQSSGQKERLGQLA